MIKSMTGYGKGETKRNGYYTTIEVKTVNHRYSNIYLHMPGYLSSLESTLQKVVKEHIDRGRVDVYMNIEEDVDIIAARHEPEINVELARRYYTNLKDLQESLNIRQELTLDTLVRLPDVLKVQESNRDEEVLHGVIIETLEKSLQSLLQMRTQEGQELFHDLVKRLDIIEKEVYLIEEREPKVIEEYKLRMRDRLKELMEDKVVDEYRLAMEVAILAERSSITEELVRLKSHLGQFRTNLLKDEAIGRKLDFIAQEMYREANTVGSKAIDAGIINSVVTIKSEVDKIREQIQNVE